MPDPTGGNTQIPPSILPKVMKADFVDVTLERKIAIIIAAVVVKQIGEAVQDPALRQQLHAATAAVLTKAIDDCGPSSRPWPPRHGGSLVAATQLASLAEATLDPAMRKDLGSAARVLSERELAAITG